MRHRNTRSCSSKGFTITGTPAPPSTRAEVALAASPVTLANGDTSTVLVVIDTPGGGHVRLGLLQHLLNGLGGRQPSISAAW